jgi:hypothetical protein
MENKESFISFFEDMQKLVRQEAQALHITEKKQKKATRSESIDKLAAALSAARKEFKPLMFNRMNLGILAPYVDLRAIYDATADALAAQEIAVVQKTLEEDGKIYLVSELIHSSDQWQKAYTALSVPDSDIKTYLSILNEHKKQHLMDLLGIAPQGYDYDDDGEQLEQLRRKEVKKGTSKEYNYADKRRDVCECINEQQLAELSYLLNSDDIVDIYDEILKMYGISRLEELPVSKYRTVFNRITEIKAARRKL